MFNQSYTTEECDLIRDDSANEVAASVTAARLTLLPCNLLRRIRRSANGVREQRRALDLKFNTTIVPSAAELSVTQELLNKRCDDAFQALMRNALRRGVERAKPGVFKDDSPLMARMFHPEPIFSGCTSSAALCVEAAGVDVTGTGAL